MNPGKIVKPYRRDENLRYGERYDPPEWSTRFQYPTDKHSFSYAIERCVGVGKCRRHENSGGGCAGLLHSIGHGFKNGHFAFEELSPFARGNPGYDLSAVSQTELGMARAERARDALDQNARFIGDENRHKTKSDHVSGLRSLIARISLRAYQPMKGVQVLY